MQLKHVLVIQTILLIAVTLLGLALKSDLSDGPRLLHRMAGFLAGITTIVSLILVLRTSTAKTLKALTIAVFILAGVSGLAGNNIASASFENYHLVYNSMFFSGILALVFSLLATFSSFKPTGETSPSVNQA
jgi:heme A synthase